MRFNQRTRPGDYTASAFGSKEMEERDWRGDRRYPLAQVEMNRGYATPAWYTEGNDMWAAGEAYPPDRTTPQQGRLINVTPSKIEYAVVDPSMRSAVPTLMGMALNKGRRWGYGVTYSESLSKNSSPLVNRALDMGLVEPNPDNPFALQSNTMDFTPYGISEPYIESRMGEMSQDDAKHLDEDVAAGKTLAREIVRGIRAKKPASQEPEHRQLSLPF